MIDNQGDLAPQAEVRDEDAPQSDSVSLEDRLLSLLPHDGTRLGNYSLMDMLGLRTENDEDKKRYWIAREHLIERGLAVKGSGRGGSTGRVLPANEIAEGSSLPPTGGGQSGRLDEKSLYAPLLKVLDSDWKSDKGFDYLTTCDVSSRGSLETGGKWTRPDLVAVQVQFFTYIPSKTLSVHTFEVKPADSIDVTAVYEALAHRRAATHSYVLLHVPDPDNPPQRLDDVINEARQHGIGVIVFATPEDYSTWEEKVIADRFEPRPEALNQFIRIQLSEDDRSLIEKTVR